MKKSANCSAGCMSRREFLGKTVLASGALSLSPSWIFNVAGSSNIAVESALNVR